jgi:hypothetical protein
MQRSFHSYHIQVQFHLSGDWISTLPGAHLTIGHSADGTPLSTIKLLVHDQAELIGLLNEIHGNGMRIVAVRDDQFTHSPTADD